MLYKIINLLLLIFPIIFFVACSDNDNNKGACDISNFTKSDILEFGYLDTNNVFHSAQIPLYSPTTSIVDLRPVTMKLTIKKTAFLDKETEECARNKMLWGAPWPSTSLPFTRTRGMFIDENCYQLYFFLPRGGISEYDYFFLKEETDSSYVFISQYFYNGIYLAPMMFFIDEKYINSIWENIANHPLYPILESPYLLRIIPALRNGHFRLEIDVPDSLTCIDNGGLRRERIETIINFRN